MLDDAIRVLIAELRTKAVSLALRVPKSAILLRLVWQETGHPFPGRLFSKDHEWWALPGDYVCDVAGVPFLAGVRTCSLSLARSDSQNGDDYRAFLEVVDEAGRLLAHVQGDKGVGDAVAWWCRHLAMQQMTRLHWRTECEPGIAGSDSQVSDIADVLDLTTAALAEMLEQPARKDAPDEAKPISQTKGVADARSKKRPLKGPSKEAFVAWQLRYLLGWEQGPIEKKLQEEFPDKIFYQSKVSRMQKSAREFIEAGGVLPPMEDSAKRVACVDPEVLDMGARQDGRTARQRPSFDAD